MATKTDFTDAEWAELHKGAAGSAMLVSLSDRDFTDTFGEAGAMSRYSAGQQTDATPELIRELARVRGTGFGLTTKPDVLKTETIAALRATVTTLQAKSPTDLESYRTYVLGMAQAVADAKGGGMGQAEAATIAEIKQALEAG